MYLIYVCMCVMYPMANEDDDSLLMYVRVCAVHKRIYVCMYFLMEDGYACVCTSICMNRNVRAAYCG
jgi:hypothetical protein